MLVDYELVVEFFVKFMDLFLIEFGQEVCFIFDGWLVFIFFGWLGQFFGIYFGSVVVIDNMISKNGEYCILVGVDFGGKFWLEVLCVGLGVQGIVLFNNVLFWYEIWCCFNGFLLDYYDVEDGDMGDGEDVKMKVFVKLIK